MFKLGVGNDLQIFYNNTNTNTTEQVYGAFYKQNSAKGAWQLKIKIKITT